MAGNLTFLQPYQILSGSTLNFSGGEGSFLNVAGLLAVDGILGLSVAQTAGQVVFANLDLRASSTYRAEVRFATQPPVTVGSLALNGALEAVPVGDFAFRAGDRIHLFSNLNGAASGDFSSLQLPPGVTGAVIREGNELILRIDSAVSSSLVNVSTRARVDVGENVLIGGFVLTGSASKRVMITAFGPSLTNYGVSGALSGTSLQVFSAETGALVAANSGWREASNAAAFAATGFAPRNEREAAVLLELAPGAYTAVVRGVNGEAGVGLMEVYDLDKAGRAVARPVNLSARARVLPGDQALIGGFVVDGQRERRVLIRALGPSLAAAGVQGALAAPSLELRNDQGSLVAANQGWQATQAAEIQATGFAPANARECAIIANLPAGAYTAVVRSRDAQATGVALVEMFDLE